MKLLIVDDEPLIRKSLSRAFSAAGHQVAEAADGESGREEWLKSKPEVAIVDVLMPGLSGPQLIDSLTNEQKNGVKIIMMSAYAGHELQKENFDLFISKPFEDIFKIVKIVEDLVKKNESN